MIKMVFQIIAGLLLVFIIGVIVFVKTAPQFGARSKGTQLEKILKSPNYRDGKFQNLVETPMSGENTSMISNGLKFLKKGGNREPKKILETLKFDKKLFQQNNNGISFSWFGHSSLLINFNGKMILSDPVFSESASPVSFMGVKRFKYSNQFGVDDLPKIDVVIISHDHYDHLDYETIKKIKDKVTKFYVPLGVAAHLMHWGVAEDKIVEMDWWDEAEFGTDLKFVATPSRHFSGRAGVDKDYTLWCSWVIKSDTSSIYYSGDSGYGDHFKQIGAAYGPFDLTMIECGQYNEGWPYIHLMPEESVQANVDLGGKAMVPIHWGKFNLSLHSWTEPIERASAEAIKLGVRLVTPVPGEIITIKPEMDTDDWWQKQNKPLEEAIVETD